MKLLVSISKIEPNLQILIRLKIIELAKHLFVHDIEQDENVFIPVEMSLDMFPASFRYYDSILCYVK